MIRGRLLNSEIISVLAAMGHTDQLVIADAGLPIPATVKNRFGTRKRITFL